MIGNPIYNTETNNVCWGWLCFNPNAIHILEQNLHRIDWWYLSENPNAIHMLEQNLDKVNWRRLSSNPNAVHILEKTYIGLIGVIYQKIQTLFIY